ncbi:MAG: hypothetical protein EOM64_04310 [Erysipelotrichia bacterium]|nr:hypothetical protein [Erysipelotrichia bacterium]
MSSNNAMSAKARAMFGERLKAEDYAVLLQKKSVGEIASYLKANTMFAECMEGVNAKSVHRGQLEVLLRTDVFDRLSKLIRYADDSAKHFATAAVMESEIELIMMAVQSFDSDQPDQERQGLITNMPMYARDFTSFDIVRLADVHSYEELLTLVKDTLYYSSLKKYEKQSLQEMDFVGLSHDLRTQYYTACLAAIRKYGRADAREQMTEIIRARIELENISIIYRMKKYFQASSAEIKKMIVESCCYFSEREIMEMIDHCSAEEIIDRLHVSKYKRYLTGAKFIYIEHYTKMISYNMNYHFIETYTAPNLVLMSYLLLSDIEIQNVVDIIEGVRYGIGQEHIRSLLIY